MIDIQIIRYFFCVLNYSTIFNYYSSITDDEKIHSLLALQSNGKSTMIQHIANEVMSLNSASLFLFYIIVVYIHKNQTLFIVYDSFVLIIIIKETMQVMAFQALLFSKDAQNSRLAGEVCMISDFVLYTIRQFI